MMTSKNKKQKTKTLVGVTFLEVGFLFFPFFFTVPKKETKIIIH